MVPLPLRSDPLSVQQTWTHPEEQSVARTCAVCGWPVVEFQMWTAAVQFGQGEPSRTSAELQNTTNSMSTIIRPVACSRS
jgi:hypothetical protein